MDGTIDTSFGTDGFNTITPGTGDFLNGISIQSDGKIVAVGQAHIDGNGFSIARYDSNGTIDTSFGTSGFNTTTPGTNDYLESISIQSDGKIVAVGQAQIDGVYGFAIVRYNSNGSVDTSFGTSGFNTTTPGTNDYLYSISIQSDGKIVAVGGAQIDGNNCFAIARYNSNGSVDTSFGTSGFTTTTLGTDDFLYGMSIQSDGKIVAVGQAQIDGVYGFAIVRYNSNGSVDTSFGTSGFNTTTPGTNDYLEGISIQSDGKIVAVGGADIDGNNVFAIVRYDSNGSVDTSFGTSGFTTTTSGTNDFLYGISIQSDGKIVAVGGADIGGNNGFAIARYNSNGSVDVFFGSTYGFNTTTPGTNGSLYGISIQSDGKIVAVGQTQIDGAYGFAIARYNSNGTIDTSFGTSGFNTTTPGTNEYLEGISIQSDGKIVAVGGADIGGNNGFAIARYNSNGSVDTSFGTSGFNTTTPGTDDFLYGMSIQSDDKIVAVGGADIGGNNGFAIARYNSNGSVDTSFGASGFTTTTTGTNGSLYGVSIQSDDKIVAVGQVQIDGNNCLAIVRYNSNGSVDTSFGTSGFNTTTPGTDDYLNGISIQSDGKIVAVGGVEIDGVFGFAIARYNSNGSVDTSFGTSGFNTTTPGTGDYLNGISIQSDGKIIAVGGAQIDGAHGFAIARYNSNGSADTSFGTSGFTTTTPGTSDFLYGMSIQSDDKIVAVGGAQIDGAYGFAIVRYNGTDVELPTIYNPLPAITFQVSIVNMQNVLSYQKPDINLSNITNQLSSASIQIPGVIGNLYDGDVFTLYGVLAARVKQVYSNSLTVVSIQ